MSSYNSTPIRCSLVLVICSLLVVGCSSSSDSNSAGSQSSVDVNDTNGDGVTSDEGANGVENESENGTTGDTGDTGDTGSEGSSTTRVNFDITVPVYVSNTLQVRLVWGDVNTTAMWNSDELWTASADLPVDTTNQLLVTFSDGNGAITLGSFETSFRTDTNPSVSFQIAADEFDTDRWDNDGDGISNLDELVAGTYSDDSDLPQPVQVSLEVLPIKTFRITWQMTPSAQFYRVLENSDGISGFTDISGELEANTTSFDHRVALYSRVNAQYMVQSCINQSCVDSIPVLVSGTLENAIGYIKASNTGESDQFGFAVSLSADGNTLAVGASRDDSAATGIDGDQVSELVQKSGAVFVYVRNGVQWQQQAYIKASNTNEEDFFGFDVSLSADGNTLAVGALLEDSAATGINADQQSNSAGDSGAAYVFFRNGAQWHQQAYLKASNSGPDDNFGRSLSLSADGVTLAVGANKEDSAASQVNGNQSDNSALDSGAVYVFKRNDVIWEQQAYIKASNTESEDLFGLDVSLSADGNTLAVGADSEDSAATGIDGDQSSNSLPGSGAVYVFVRNGELWQQQVYLKASNTTDFNGFGDVVTLSADSNTLVVGARNESSAATGVNGEQDDRSLGFAGAAYVFVRRAEIWEQQAYLKASNSGTRDSFGRAISLSADGNILAIGASGEDSAATGIAGDQNNDAGIFSGAVYTFERSAGLWQQQTYIKASNTDNFDRFGFAISVSADGNTLAVGADSEDSAATGMNGDQVDNSAEQSGAVYIY